MKNVSKKGQRHHGVLTHLTVRRAPADPTRGIVNADGRTLPCALGRTGIAAVKREGDGATPAAVLHPVRGFFRPDRVRRPVTPLAMQPIGPLDGWCDDPADANYNRHVTLPFAASHEAMARADRLYDICIVLDWNLEPFGRKRFGGSAIFLHLAKPGFPPTEGCIAVEPDAMCWLLPRIGRRTEIQVVG